MRSDSSALSLRLRVVLGLSVAIALVVSACGDDDSASSGSASSGSASSGSGTRETAGSGTQTTMRLPCTDASPFKITANPQWARMIIVCQYSDTSVDIVNVSPAVLAIEAPQAARVDITRPASPPGDLASTAKQEVFKARVPLAGRFQLPPEGTATAVRAGGAQQVYLEVDKILTAETYAADIVAKWVAGKVSRPTDKMGKSAASCAREVGDVFSERATGTTPPPIELVVVDAIQAGRACRPLANELAQLDGRPPPPPATVSAEVKAITRSFGSAAIDEFLKLLRRALL